MRQTEFQIGDRCLFSFSGDKNIPVEIVGCYTPKDECVWASPEDANKRMPYAIDKTINGRYAFATHINHLQLIERPSEEDGKCIDISTLI